MLLVPHRRSAPLRAPARPLRRPSLEHLETRVVPVTNLGALTLPTTVHGMAQAAQTFPPQVAIDGNGSRFVIAWTDVGASGVSVHARVLSSDGAFLTGVIDVTTSPLPVSADRPINLDVGIDAAGRFAVIYDGLPRLSGQADIGLNRYLADGTPYGTTAVVGLANRTEINPQVDLADDGRIALAYDQWATGPDVHRLTTTLYASFENLDQFTTTSISSTGGEITTQLAFNADGQYVLAGTTFTNVATTRLRVFNSLGIVSSSSTVTSSTLLAPALADVPGQTGWRLVYLDESGGVDQLMTLEVTQGVNTSAAPLLGTPTVLLTDVSDRAAPVVAVEASGEMAVGYLVESGGADHLVVGFLSPDGSAFREPVVVVSNAATFGLARGATVSKGLAIYAVQTGPVGSPGSLVDYAVRGTLLTPDVPPPALPGPPASPAPTPDAPPAYDATLVNALLVPDLVPVAPTVSVPSDDVFSLTSGPMGGDLTEFLERTAPYFDTEGLGSLSEQRREEEPLSVTEPKPGPEAGRDVVFEFLEGAGWPRDDGDAAQSPVGAPADLATAGG